MTLEQKVIAYQLATVYAENYGDKKLRSFNAYLQGFEAAVKLLKGVSKEYSLAPLVQKAEITPYGMCMSWGHAFAAGSDTCDCGESKTTLGEDVSYWGFV